MNETLLRTGSRVAVLGGGPAGAAAAAALMATARRLGKLIDVTLYHSGASPDELSEPLVVDEPTMVRLAALGMGVPQGYLSSYEGIVFHGESPRSPGHGLRRRIALVTPGAPAGALRRLMRGVATGLGARLVPFPGALLASSDGPTPDVVRVRARGLVQPADLLVLATGVRGPASRDALEEARPRLRLGAAMWLRSARPLPLRFTSQLQLHARGGAWVTVVPVGSRLFVTVSDAGDRLERAFELVTWLQRDGLLPSELSVDRAWGRLLPLRRPARPIPGAAIIGEAAGPLWPLASFGAAVAQGLRLAEDALVLSYNPAPQLRQRRRAEAAERAATARWREVARMGKLDLSLPRNASLATWALTGQDGGAPSAAFWTPGALRRLQGRLARWFAGAPRRAAAAPSGNLVYLVDDDAATCFALAGWLHERGIQVRTFTDELSVPACAARERPAAILLDVVLRRIDGPTLLGWLRRDPITARIPVVMISGTALLVPKETHPYAFLEKPLNPGALLDLLRPLIPTPSPATSAAGA